MGLETGTYISDLNASNPTPVDPKSQGDDNIRLIKAVLKASLPNFSGPMTIAHNQVASIDYVNQTAFSTALPAQPGGTTLYQITSTNGAASWQPVRAIFDDTARLAQAQAVALYF